MIVYRGQYGTVTSISVRDLVVGDIIDIQQGDRVPADCILIDETNITVDQSNYNPTETAVEKEMSFLYQDSTEPDNHKSNPDPFLLSSTMIMTGSGRAIVCCVGENTRLAKSTKPQDMVIKEQKTFLEEKLETLSQQITKWAIVATILIILLQTIFLLLQIMFNGQQKILSTETLMSCAKIVILAVCILIVAIPEGLPLAVSIAMALSIN